MKAVFHQISAIMFKCNYVFGGCGCYVVLHVQVVFDLPSDLVWRHFGDVVKLAGSARMIGRANINWKSSVRSNMIPYFYLVEM